MENDKELRCRKCDRKLQMGADVVGIQDGVIGPRGFVPLGEMELVCDNDECADQNHVSGSAEKIALNRRIP